MLPQFFKTSAKKNIVLPQTFYFLLAEKIINTIQTNLNINFIFFLITLCIVELPMDHLFHLQNCRKIF